jgi:predicted alpha/beta hydrolase family esterase
MATTLIVPGLHDSGPDHWQTWIERQTPGALRVTQDDWGLPDLRRWARKVANAIDASAEPPVIVAHSFGVLAAVQALKFTRKRAGGLLLVAPADPDTFGYDRVLPATPLRAPAILAASRNDPWMTYDRALTWAYLWGARVEDQGHVAHINVDSGHGPWPTGIALFRELQRVARKTPQTAG